MNSYPSVALVDVLDDRNADDRENLGLASIAAFLRQQGLRADLHSLLVSEPSTRGIGGHHDVVAFSVYPNTVTAVFRFAVELKGDHPDLLVGLGGRLATDAAAELLAGCPAVDFCVLGDGEVPMLGVTDAIRAGRSIAAVPHVAARASAPARMAAQVDVASLPWPARDYLPASLAHGNPTARLNSSWGCLASCSFCSVNSFFDLEIQERRHAREEPNRSELPLQQRAPLRKKWRARTPDDVFAEILSLNAEYGVRSFVFNDPSFEDPGRVGKDRVRALCELILTHPHSLAFRCSMRAESFTEADAGLLGLMRQAGFSHVFIGIESGSDTDLTNFQKIARVSDNSAALALFARAGIDVTMGFIMLNPYSTRATVRANHEFLVASRASKVDNFTRKVDVYYRTSLHERLTQDGLLRPGFSYDTPLAYMIRDRAVAELDHALDAVRNDQVCGEFDARMYHLSYSLSTLRALDPGTAERPGARFERVSAAAAGLLARFFEPVLRDGDRTAIDAGLPALRTELSRLSRELRAIGAQVAFAPVLRRLLVPSTSGS